MAVSVTMFRKAHTKMAAELHKSAFEKDHFTSRFPVFMLENFYTILINDNRYAYVAVDGNNRVVGISVAGEQTRSAIKTFIKKYWYQLAGVIMLNPEFVLAKLKHFRVLFGNQKKHFTSAATLRYICLIVDPEYHGQGIGKMLMQKFESDLKRDQKNFYGFSVKRTNTKATRFHLKNGSLIEHEDMGVIYFTKTI